MKKVILILGVLLTITHASGASTKGGYAICFQKEWLSELISFMVNKDRSSYEAYFDSRKCVMVKGGIKVTIIESPGVFGTTTGFVVDGVKAWTLREGINYKD